ncbi:beta family protein [Pseudomonas entomophila]|uniref:beta family protein n=1 Tax=Pseudomonas entomophila TaxID=312306 RepID=UPI00200EC75C|nr:beta family protein [Pseudomonas entomophila]
MQYSACLRVGQNDIKALINLEPERRTPFTPLLDMRGDDDRHLQTFLNNWTEHPFFIDVSRGKKDVREAFISAHDLHNPANAFEEKRKFIYHVRDKNPNVIPVISWSDDDAQRDVIQLSLSLERDFKNIAIRVTCPEKPTPISRNRLLAILDSLSAPTCAHIILDFIASAPASTASGSDFDHLLRDIGAYTPATVILLSTSFPIDKPASNSSRSATCFDTAWQATVNRNRPGINLVYGDYAATNPTAPMEYVVGMPVLPFGCYYTPTEWWQRRKGGDKEFVNYIEIADEIRRLPGYHGDGFCWATREYTRIVATSTNYGNNGTWNGYRINQHICAMLKSILDRERAVLEPIDIDDLDDLI